MCPCARSRPCERVVVCMGRRIVPQCGRLREQIHPQLCMVGQRFLSCRIWLSCRICAKPLATATNAERVLQGLANVSGMLAPILRAQHAPMQQILQALEGNGYREARGAELDAHQFSVGTRASISSRQRSWSRTSYRQDIRLGNPRTRDSDGSELKKISVRYRSAIRTSRFRVKRPRGTCPSCPRVYLRPTCGAAFGVSEHRLRTGGR